MKKIFLTLPVVAILFSCGGASAENENEETSIEQTSYAPENEPEEGSNRALLMGEWSSKDGNLNLTASKTHFTLSDSTQTLFDSDYQLSYSGENTDLTDQIDHGHNIHLLDENKVLQINILTETNLSFNVEGDLQAYRLEK